VRQLEEEIESLTIVSEEPVGGNVTMKTVPLEASRQPADAIGGLE